MGWLSEWDYCCYDAAKIKIDWITSSDCNAEELLNKAVVRREKRVVSARRVATGPLGPLDKQ